MSNGSDIRKNERIRVTFCAYREWALNAIRAVQSDGRIEVVDIIKSEEAYNEVILRYPDLYVDCIVFVGWSWIIRDDILSRFLCVGMHPSDLPKYRGGSPIQHQIINGVEKTKISLMTISPNGVDVGDIWMKEEWDLSGQTMNQILGNLSASTEKLLRSFFESFGDITPVKQDLSEGSYYKRRKPEDSRVTWNELSQMSLKEVYNLVRALGDPYPNIYIEDEEGNRLMFKEVEYMEAIDGKGSDQGIRCS